MISQLHVLWALQTIIIYKIEGWIFLNYMVLISGNLHNQYVKLHIQNVKLHIQYVKLHIQYVKYFYILHRWLAAMIF